MKKFLLIPILFLSAITYGQQVDTLLGLKGKLIKDTAVTISGSYLITPTTTSLSFDSSKVVTGVILNSTFDSIYVYKGGVKSNVIKQGTGSGGGGTPGGSSGTVQFNNSGAFGGDASLFWDNTNKRLGIGTGTPRKSLSVIGNVNIGEQDASLDVFPFSIKDSATGGIYLWRNSNDPRSEAFVFLKSGNGSEGGQIRGARGTHPGITITNLPGDKIFAKFDSTGITADSVKAVLGNFNTAKIITANITNDNITNANITNAGITSATIGTATITTDNITTANIGAATIATAGITTANIATDNITTANITTAGITTANIATANISTAFKVGTGTGSDNAAVTMNAGTGSSFSGYYLSNAFKGLVGVAGGTDGLVTGSSANDMVIRTSQKMLFAINGSTVKANMNTSGNWYFGGSTSATEVVDVGGNIKASGTIKTGGYTVATLPAAGNVGRTAYVTDATAPTYLGTLTGGGSVITPVFDNGTIWVAH